MLKNTRDALPSGWKYPITVEGNEIMVIAYYYDDLMRELRQKCAFHKIECPTEEQVQEYLTSINPENFSRSGGQKFHATLPKLQSWVRAAYATYTKSADAVYVTPEEAVERAKICSGCPHNVNNWGCWSCVLADIGAGILAPDRSTPIDVNLKACEICGCPLEKSIHYKQEYLPDGEYPEWCWRRK